jgi:chromate reductase, NAD(P)H dehydrogenase (quinone)
MPPGAELDLSQLGVAGRLPHYDADLEAPPEAAALKDALRAADGLLIATPEYNWGIPGFLKNAVDWASRPSADVPEVFGDLPVALIGAGGGSGTRNAQAAWLPVFRYLGMRPWAGELLHVDRARERFGADLRLGDEATRRQLQSVVRGFAEHCKRLPRTRAR